MKDEADHIRRWLKAHLQNGGRGTGKRLAAYLGVRPDALSRMTSDKGETRQITAVELERMCAFFGTSPLSATSRRTRSPPRSIVEVPLVSWVSAGKLTGSEVPPNVRVEKRIPVADLASGEWIALRVQGDSMNLIAPDGSIIFVDVADKRLAEDRFYVFGQENGDSTFKRYRGGRKPRLQPYSTNPDHETIPANDELFVVGRARRTMLDF